MSQDEDEDEDETERTDNATVKNDKKTTNAPGDEIKEERPTAVKQTTKHLSITKLKPKSDTDSKQRSQVQNNLKTQQNAPPSTEVQFTLLVPVETNNPQKKVKRKSVTTPTKEMKLNLIKTKRKPNRSET